MKHYLALETESKALVFAEIISKEKVEGLSFIENPDDEPIERVSEFPRFSYKLTRWDMYRLTLGKAKLFEESPFQSRTGNNKFIKLKQGYAETIEVFDREGDCWVNTVKPTTTVMVPLRSRDKFSPFILSFETDTDAELFFEMGQI